jgi:hypothetical protein
MKDIAMNKIILSVLLLGLLVLTSATVYADPPTQSRETYAVAATSFAEDECVDAQIGVLVHDGWYSDVSGKTTLRSASIHYFRYDFCNGVALLVANGEVPITDETFRRTGNLASATLNTTIPVKDVLSPNTFSLGVSLTWIANGPQYRLHDNQDSSYDDIRINFLGVSIIQPTDISGSITLDGKDLIAGQHIGGDMGRGVTFNVTISH